MSQVTGPGYVSGESDFRGFWQEYSKYWEGFCLFYWPSLDGHIFPISSEASKLQLKGCILECLSCPRHESNSFQVLSHSSGNYFVVVAVVGGGW